MDNAILPFVATVRCGNVWQGVVGLGEDCAIIIFT